MAVAIRLRREGNRNRAYYRIVVADKRARRDGRFIETLGTYDPNQNGINYKVDVTRADDWITKGAQPSDTVRSILKKARRQQENAPVPEEEETKQDTAPAVDEPKAQPAAAEPEAKAETPAPAETEAPAEAEAPAETEAEAKPGDSAETESTPAAEEADSPEAKSEG